MTWALLTVMNYLVTGTVDANIAPIVRQALKAEPILRARLSHRFEVAASSFFTTLALLLTPLLLQSPEGRFRKLF